MIWPITIKQNCGLEVHLIKFTLGPSTSWNLLHGLFVSRSVVSLHWLIILTSDGPRSHARGPTTYSAAANYQKLRQIFTKPYRWKAWNLGNMARGDNKREILDEFDYHGLAYYVTSIFGFHTLQNERKIHYQHPYLLVGIIFPIMRS